ncbi:hypothetical protein KP509_03G048700 [Ceratopteris richardii]|uniref:Bifunctional inhibitor/plant lipid transfer protein/seed storage helical domain-containing protein n=1 Tax=Ceratopteris richardii TaxID=49495 RepID=A0A8T2V2R1_CERRI|nr:hypothetical protein KP509_03G048700 [Ceratopteris richardii]
MENIRLVHLSVRKCSRRTRFNLTIPKSNLLSLLIIILLCMFNGKVQASDEAADDSRCSNILDQLSPCNPYIASSNPTSEPSNQCCTQLQAVDLSCMCGIVTGPSLPNVDKARALGLPQACNLPTGGLARIDNIAECTSD